MHEEPTSQEPTIHDIVTSLPRVVIHDHLEGGPGIDIAALQTPTALRDAVAQAVRDLAADNVVYAELRMSPELYTAGGLTLSEAVDSAIGGLDAADGIDVRLVLTAQRSGTSLADVAALTVARHGAVVVGMDVAGPEDGYPLAGDSESFALLRANYVPFSVHVGLDAGIESIAEAIQLGATRLGHATRIVDDFGVDIEGIVPGKVSSWVRDRHIPLEIAPTLEVQLGAADSLGDHPLTLLQQLGFTCTVNPGIRSATGMSDQFLALADTFGYGVEEFFDLTVNAVQASYLTEVERQELLERIILPAYEALDMQAGLDEFDATDFA